MLARFKTTGNVPVVGYDCLQ